jgi:hypothetical protein
MPFRDRFIVRIGDLQDGRFPGLPAPAHGDHEGALAVPRHRARFEVQFQLPLGPELLDQARQGG